MTQKNDGGPKLWRDMNDAQRGAVASMGGWIAHNASVRGIELWNEMCEKLGVNPPEPREFWIVGGSEAYDSLQEAQDDCSKLMWPSIVHVREVMP